MTEYKINSLEKEIYAKKNNEKALTELVSLYEAYIKQYPESSHSFEYLFNLSKIQIAIKEANE